MGKKKKDKTTGAEAATDFEHTEAALEKRAAKYVSTKDQKGAHAKARDFSYTQNREVSWLRFDNRVLDEAFDETVPLFERLKFVSIFGSNLDEWFMIRIGGLSDLTLLKHQPRENKSNQTPSEQIDTVLGMLPDLIARQGRAFASIERSLAEHGLTRVSSEDLTDADRAQIKRTYDLSIAPIISPMIIDPRHPFPNLRNGNLYVTCTLDGADEKGLLGIVEVPTSLGRVIKLPSTEREYRYILMEDAMLEMLSGCFGDYAPTASAVIRVTRNADIDPDGEGVEEEEDYRQHMKKVLKRRQRLQPVRLEVEGYLPEEQLAEVQERLGLTSERVFQTDMPLDLDGYVYGLEGKIPEAFRGALVFDPFVPQVSPMVDASRPMRPQVEDHDVLLTYPYESMSPLLQLLREASGDDACISIKITLYRVAKRSKLCESLIAASENGKEVTVLMELRARFDEANNIEWADRLEQAGCTVIYGQEGFKVHSKICQITYHDASGISRITCLGTGNFNEKTAKLYSDFMLLTAHKGIAEDGNTFFRNLSLGNLKGSYSYLGVAPTGLKPLVMRGLNREIGRARAGEPAQVFMKMNSLTDRDVIDKISEACRAGVRVMLVIRGICCIKADIPDKTEGLIAHQIVGRFLEHARVYAFGVDTDILYLSSADMMTRNTERRVEIAYPVLDPECKERVIEFVNLQLADNVKARRLTREGTWEKLAPAPDDPRIDAQELLLAKAYLQTEEYADAAVDASLVAKANPMLEADASQTLQALPQIGRYEVDVDGEPQVRTRIVTPEEFVREERQILGIGDAQDGATPAAQPDQPAASEPPAPVPAAPAAPKHMSPAEKDETPSPEEDASKDGPTPVATPEAPAASEPEPAPKPAPAPQPAPAQHPAPVDARVIEDEPPAEHETRNDAQTTSIEIRRPNRFAVALKLIGLGFAELFTGNLTRRSR
ncbi:polyphosphate kinase 1 [Parafannyhessea umbonata]|uniref:polyphosphate kinase 1 n=2 Tax=Parafannyhessea umbonata TaxID=604330 RepID=UPI0026EC4DB1|nr:polyphosphate kinase 1 [Parafannyhessea umbonata]MDD6566691.1 polyphosphate kinase 1 [Parafannyhessea umbonata]MDD6601130.1 polyphosphate kinase 1 [Parafannyhessea umbonata]